MASRQTVLATVSVIVPLVLLVLASLFLWSRVSATASPPKVAALEGTDVFPPGARPAPAFTLRDQSGRVVSLAGWNDRTVALTFLDSHCRKECPVTGRELAAVQKRLGYRSKLVIVAVSVAPTTDTPASARTFARESHWRSSWYWLFGSPNRLARVWRQYGIYVKPTAGDIIHTAAVYLIHRGSVRVSYGVPFVTDQMIQSVRVLESASH